MDAHASDPETAGGEPQFASRSRAWRRCTASRPAACCTPARPLRATRGAARYAMPLGSRACRLLLRLRCLNPSLAVFRKIPSACRRRWSVIGGLLVAAVFIAVAVHAHSSRGAAVLAAVAPAKGGASQLFRGSEYLHRDTPGARGAAAGESTERIAASPACVLTTVWPSVQASSGMSQAWSQRNMTTRHSIRYCRLGVFLDPVEPAPTVAREFLRARTACRWHTLKGSSTS